MLDKDVEIIIRRENERVRIWLAACVGGCIAIGFNGTATFYDSKLHFNS